LSAILTFCFHIFFFFFLVHSHVKRSKFLGLQGWVEILMITMVFSCFLPWANNLHPSVKPSCLPKVSQKKVLVESLFFGKKVHIAEHVLLISKSVAMLTSVLPLNIRNLILLANNGN
jgi:hypothetical protein